MSIITESETFLAECPLDVLILITECLTIREVAKFCRSKSVLHRRLWRSETLWKRRYLHDICTQTPPNTTTPNTTPTTAQKAVIWSAEYRRVIGALRGKNRWKALSHAAKNGYDRLLDGLLEPTPSVQYLNHALLKSAEGGHRDIVDDLLARGATDAGGAMIYAARGGHLDIVHSMMARPDRRRPLFDVAMREAAYRGHLNIVLEMMGGAQREGDYVNWDGTLSYAARGGHEEIMQAMINRGANNWNQAMAMAARGGQHTIIRRMIEGGANDWNQALHQAAYGGHLDIVRQMIDRGANTLNGVMAQAAAKGHVDIVEEMVTRGAQEWNWTLTTAAGGGHVSLVKRMRDLGALDWNRAFDIAVQKDQLAVVIEMTTWVPPERCLPERCPPEGCRLPDTIGPSLDLDGALSRAIYHNHREIIDYLQRIIAERNRLTLIAGAPGNPLHR